MIAAQTGNETMRAVFIANPIPKAPCKGGAKQQLEQVSEPRK